jgi:hypothetical protein
VRQKEDNKMKMVSFITVLAVAILLMGADSCSETQDARDQRLSDDQLSQYSKRQPIPTFDWSLERELIIKLYELRNKQVATHSVWRSALGTVEDDCPSIGFGLPYDTSLTNPLKPVNPSWRDSSIVEQQEPNGVYASKNTSATWIMCTGPGGSLEPHYVETKVTVYPYAVEVDYEHNRVRRAGGAKASASLRLDQK